MKEIKRDGSWKKDFKNYNEKINGLKTSPEINYNIFAKKKIKE